MAIVAFLGGVEMVKRGTRWCHLMVLGVVWCACWGVGWGV